MEKSSNWDVGLAVAVLLAVVGLGAATIYWAHSYVKRWLDASARTEEPTQAERLAPYSKMVDEGELAPEEFARIMARLEGRDEPADIEKPPTVNQPPNTSIQE
jgi:hypothetical protein